MTANNANEVPTPVQFLEHLRLAIVEWQAALEQQRDEARPARRSNTNRYSMF